MNVELLIQLLIFYICRGIFATTLSANFRFTGYINSIISDKILQANTIQNTEGVKIDCISKCLQSIHCNAVEVCYEDDSVICKLSWGVKYLNSGIVDQCQRFEMVNFCNSGGYLDRIIGHCVYENMSQYSTTSLEYMTTSTQYTTSAEYITTSQDDTTTLHGYTTTSTTQTTSTTASPQCPDCECAMGSTPSDGVYTIELGGLSVNVLCIYDGNNVWTVIQRREDGSENFYRQWNDYKSGFGSLTSEFWLGNEVIHLLTTSGHTRLRIDLEDKAGLTRYAEYETFSIQGENDNYRINIADYSGNAGDSFNECNANADYCHNGMSFSTYETDNDMSSGYNCAAWAGGAWWYNGCFSSNLNGRYNYDNNQGVLWRTWKGVNYSLKKTRMMIRKD